jgi:hypothetical protein
MGLWGAGSVLAQAAGDAAPKANVVLVELFTSEGCSSCPPADAMLREIDGKTLGAKQLIVGISEHVTYWNSLGWADPFSSTIYTQRQTDYGNRFGLDSVYTPQMVVNGTEQFVGGDRSRLAEALRREEKQAPALAVRILSASVSGAELTLKYAVEGEFPTSGIDLIAVLADDSDTSSVRRGENSGRTLTHVAVARSLTRVAQAKAAKEGTATIALPASYRSGDRHHAILFAQKGDGGRILGVDTKSF